MSSGISGLTTIARGVHSLLDKTPHWLIALLSRFAAAQVFWRSARTKVDGWDIWNVTDNAVLLFEYEYQVPLLDPRFAATMASIAEHVFPVLLVLGLATRLSAGALMVMTLVIQVFVYPEAWPTHILWAVPLLYLIGRGPGMVSLDRVLGIDK